MAAIEDQLSREAIRNADRLVFLSDGVYAIALTILVLDINRIKQSLLRQNLTIKEVPRGLISPLEPL